MTDPSDKPGYIVVTLDSNDDHATKQLNDLEAQGYRVVIEVAAGRIIMQRGYKG